MVSPSRLRREASITAVDAGVLSLGAVALFLGWWQLAAIVAFAHAALSFALAVSKPVWVATSVIAWAIAAAVLYGLLWLSRGTVDYWALGAGAILLPGIGAALLAGAGHASQLADLIPKTPTQ